MVDPSCHGVTECSRASVVPPGSLPAPTPRAALSRRARAPARTSTLVAARLDHDRFVLGPAVALEVEVPEEAHPHDTVVADREVVTDHDLDVLRGKIAERHDRGARRLALQLDLAPQCRGLAFRERLDARLLGDLARD